MTCHIIGAGKLGLNLAYALNAGKLIEIKALCNRSLKRAQQSVALIGCGQAVADLTALPPASLIFITTGDDEIAQVANVLAEHHCVEPGTIVAHCSGVLSADILKPLADRGCLVASIHPLKAFLASSLQASVFAGCHCAVEGNPQAVNYLTALFQQLGAVVHTIKADKKEVYHAAAVMASNYLVTLAHHAQNLLQESGLSDNHAMAITQQLLQSSLHNLQQHNHPRDALTGPLMRGDYNTLEKHINAIQQTEVKDLYCTAALATLELTSHDKTQILKLASLLDAEDSSALMANNHKDAALNHD